MSSIIEFKKIDQPQVEKTKRKNVLNKMIKRDPNNKSLRPTDKKFWIVREKKGNKTCLKMLKHKIKKIWTKYQMIFPAKRKKGIHTHVSYSHSYTDTQTPKDIVKGFSIFGFSFLCSPIFVIFLLNQFELIY